MAHGCGTCTCMTTRAAPPIYTCRSAPGRSISGARCGTCNRPAMTARSRSRSLLPTPTTWRIAGTCFSGSGPRSGRRLLGFRTQGVPHLGRELIGGEGLGKEVVHPRLAEVLHDLDVAVAAHGDDRDLRVDPA